MCVLTERERQCAALLAEGKRLDEAAHIIGISKRTLDFHLSNARRKLNAKTTTQAVLLYSACGCSSHGVSRTTDRRANQRRRFDKVSMLMLSRPAASSNARSWIQTLVDKSYVRCATTGRFASDFYQAFLNSSPLVAEKFANTDMEHQARLLDYAIRTLILFFRDPMAVTVETIRALGVLHDRQHLNIDPSLYDPWLDALLAAVEKNDPDFNRQLANAWGQVVRHGVAAMRSVREG
ncbi:LuxR C-terminal-related transcriptional regulator [Methylogaea oryzae]|uniref:HTH luxR-type domain-containing protein n=1 Tax=Methylogaea oryzae TaxID=1295382 RepID=A0A8D4VNF2_9GAMM|nr:LuxR C-terminal-related transcriptional regulator [Methylogaea oryzae]BBL69565.1 hypothetical protein MoryE10_01710 [Methylogaea oryzae]